MGTPFYLFHAFPRTPAAGSAALIVHHVRKSDGQIRDSSDIAAAADMLVELDAGKRSGAAPDPDVMRRRLTYRGRWDESTRWLDFNTATGRYTAADEPADPQGTGMMPGTAESRLDVAVTKYLMQHEHDGTSVRQVARALSRRDAAVRGSLKRVADRGTDERWRPSRGGRPETPDPYSVGTTGTPLVPKGCPTPVPVDGMTPDAPVPKPPTL